MEQLNKYVIMGLLVAFLAGVAIIVDVEMPIFSFKMPLGDGIHLKVSVFDHNNGFMKRMIENAKTIVQGWKEIDK